MLVSENKKFPFRRRFPFQADETKQKFVIRIDHPNIELVLSRTEVSLDDSPDQSFHFTWDTKIQMNLNDGVKSLTAKVNIVAFEFGEAMKTLLKRELRELLEPFVDENGGIKGVVFRFSFLFLSLAHFLL